MSGRSIIVQKFGGTSVGTIDRMRKVAEIVADEKRAGHDVVVVVSAMAGETNRLVALAETAAADPSPREMDCLLATGEQVSVALLAMILNEHGVPARSILGFQMGMLTDAAHTKARILEIDRRRFTRAFDEGLVLVAAGFQGIDPDGDVTTLGRGGSDTTAVAIAAGLDAKFCDIYTDVDGVYTADPNIVADARRLDRISYEEMIELASSGAKVLQIRSVEMAMKYGVPVRVRSTFTRGLGTLVTREEPSMEGVVVAGVSCDRNEARIALRRVPDVPGLAARVFTPLSKANIVVDMIIQNSSVDGSTDLTFTVPRADLKQALKVMKDLAASAGIAEVEPDSTIAKVSIVGVGMRSHAGAATTMFKALAEEGINIKMISTSEIKISAVIDEKYAELAVRALHRVFDLGQGQKVSASLASSSGKASSKGAAPNGAPTNGAQAADALAPVKQRAPRGAGRRPRAGIPSVLANGKHGPVAGAALDLEDARPETSALAERNTGRRGAKRVASAEASRARAPKSAAKSVAPKASSADAEASGRPVARSAKRTTAEKRPMPARGQKRPKR